MDWFTLLLIFFFFVLPLIQQIVQSRKQAENPPGLPGEEEVDLEHEFPVELEGQRRRPGPAESIEAEEHGDGWSSGWGAWPGETVETEAEEHAIGTETEPSLLEQVRVLREQATRAERSNPEIRPERVVFERPVPAEPVYVEHRAEGPRVQSRTRVLSTPVLGVRRGATDIGRAVHDRQELRRAVILAEVLGPPRSLGELKQERD
ncbi:hypothetical protein BH23GEM8_BH23GEM8_13800 [soil metagenome]